MAPEVIDCEYYDERADIYSFAVIMFELLFGIDHELRTFEGTCTYWGVINGLNPFTLLSASFLPSGVVPLMKAVSAGKRPTIPKDFTNKCSAAMKDLIIKGWSGNASRRPSCTDFLNVEDIKNITWLDKHNSQQTTTASSHSETNSRCLLC